MEREQSPEIDDELFNEVYGKAYTGPTRVDANSVTPKGNSNKRSFSGSQSDEEDLTRDPNAVPTDFTSREAKVWEAKAKATERNWKKRKEEEMICKICGESGHFTQGCPSTLGANRKSADCFQRVPARDKNVRALFSENVINQIEKDTECKIKMDEKFLIVSGKDQKILAKGVDAVHKLIHDDKDKQRSPAGSNRTYSRSPDQSPRGSYSRRSDSQRSHSSPRSESRFSNRGFNHERITHDLVREDRHKFSRDSSQARAYVNDGGKGRPVRSKSPVRATFGSDAFRSYERHNFDTGMHKTNSLDNEGLGMGSIPHRKFDIPNHQEAWEELEMEFKREAMEVEKMRDQEEDEENYKHRECLRELRDNYVKKLATVRSLHRKQCDEFHQLDMQRRQQANQTYNQPAYLDYEQSARNVQYADSGFPVDSRNRYPFPGGNYSASKPHDTYGEFQRQRHEDFGKTYGRY